ncbi:hypothetical protein MPTK1_1g17600 [Marchantia polymorpha subsp. ruderalis]|uniref:COBRA C-terminal domain-containing protein n=2 Tax=Marchantia polymorpha TaxID=3197 RepID=A0AAF6AR95_MARPO|nr:hypothetical protein MARPO_0001s0100 [Marchantia polymorpha]BBM98965.1 hypothetical protein Mp_1g17600 [Marchantia polymorpha subsp. ruderalis]|eukprot:PTQ50042.1 hypothetical protein MARPO_0001s0100 [Marchantia polymorpha]
MVAALRLRATHTTTPGSTLLGPGAMAPAGRARGAGGGQGPWSRAAPALALLVCVCSLWLPSGVEAVLPFGANISALPLSQQYLYTCEGVIITYTVDENVERIIPISPKNATQPYKFDASGTLTNAGYEELQNWELWIGFQHDEVLADAPGLIISSGLEKVPGALVGNGTTIVGVANPDLLTSIDTAENLDLIQVDFKITGTEFGVGPGQPIEIPLPKNVTLMNPGYNCSKPEMETNVTMVVCCTENRTKVETERNYLRRQVGDINIFYDVLAPYGNSYTARVTIDMDDPIGRIDHWNLTWSWMFNEFISSMQGAQTLEQVQEDCLTGPIFEAYPDMDFSTVMSCQSTPSIVDLDSSAAFNPANPPGCCRNGSLLPAAIDPKATKSVFTMTVMKGRTQVGRDIIDPPGGWHITELNKPGEEYKCGGARLVEPTQFPGPGLHTMSAARTWQVTCNKTVLAPKAPRKCCVSFSGFYNTSVIPCPTCACGGCGPLTRPPNPKCNPNIDPMLLPTYGLLLPPSNRTRLALDLAIIERWPVPTPKPCPDNCGVAINWHVYSDYTNGFSTRLTLFNWETEVMPQWFVAVQLNKTVMPGYLDTYSFNGSTVKDLDPVTQKNNTLIFLQGKEGYNNFLMGLDKGLVPGKVQSLMSFDKRLTPGIDVVGGDGFPQKVWFNGDECAMPTYFPTSAAARSGSLALGMALALALPLLLLLL